MSMSKRTRTVILWVIAIGLLVGMVISFTPTMGLTWGGQTALLGTPQILVNGEPIREAEVTQASQGTLFNAVSEGPVAEDLQRLLVDELVRQKVIEQAAAPVRVSNGDVRDEVDDFREARGVAGRGNDRNYVSLIGSAGFTDQTFRDYLREQLRITAWEESLIEDVTVSDAEIEAHYLSHPSSYQSEEQILARHIVVEDQELAEQIRAEVVAGASFAELAAEHSTQLAERQGALGAQEGEAEPSPVGRPALPTAVANAAFALRGAGLTDVVESAGVYHLVQVEEYLPAATRPLEEVRETVAEDALNAKKQGVVEAEVERLRAEATVSFPETSTLSFDNPTIAIVGDTEISEVQL
ncbi:MAG TPA: peptidyl-prolyl cis-trans isomerase, partial [Trueperaceae bacterium]|nr:peptidyl-prolyl cis-trans isomerase [Trueperaceae bacterium]